MSADKPNVIIIFSDQHRPDWMGCSGDPGSRLVRTPNLDALASRGVLFNAAYCNAPLCGPSRMSFMTGRHPWRNGVYINEDPLPTNVPTIAHAMGLAGYETVMCGRMHFDGWDQRHGFDRRLVGDVTPILAGGPRTNYGVLEGSSSNTLKAVTLAGPGDSPVLQYDEHATQAFERYCSERQAGNDDKPAFVVVGWYGPHHPFTAPPDLYENARRRLVQACDQAVPPDRDPVHPWVANHLKFIKTGSTDEERLAMVRANYAAMIDRMDALIGRVLSAAEKLQGSTLIIYVSDHGEMAGDRMMIAKCCFFEPSVRVPMIFAPLGNGPLPCRIAAGGVSKFPVSLLDVLPTLTGLVNATPLPLYDGADLRPLLENPDGGGNARTWNDRAVFSELTLLANPPIRMVRQGRYKYTYCHGYNRHFLYDLETDGLEQDNLAGDARFADIENRLKALVFTDWNPEKVRADADEKAAIRKYVMQWARSHGTAALELWNPQKPVYEFGGIGEPLSYL